VGEGGDGDYQGLRERAVSGERYDMEPRTLEKLVILAFVGIYATLIVIFLPYQWLRERLRRKR
jgi:hypothetical protein